MNAEQHRFLHADAASGWYGKLIALYPSSYLARHREELLQNYEDLRRDMGTGVFFWIFIAGDFIKSITQQYMEFIKKNRWAQVGIGIVALLLVLGIWQFFTLKKAHSSLANYAAFRGCVTMTSATDATATCALSSGQSITMVRTGDKWYLAGDLPVCWFGKYCW